MNCQINMDMVIAIAKSIDGVILPNELVDIPITQLRFDNENIVNANHYHSFFIDEFGKKHIVQHNNHWQAIECTFDAELTKDSGLWRIKTDSDKLSEAKEFTKGRLVQITKDTRAQVANHADPYKLAGWADKAQRARRVLAGNGNDTDITTLQAECDTRTKNESAEDLARKQTHKANTLGLAIAIIDGIESATLDAIDKKRNANTLADLLATAQTELDHVITKVTESD